MMFGNHRQRLPCHIGYVSSAERDIAYADLDMKTVGYTSSVPLPQRVRIPERYCVVYRARFARSVKLAFDHFVYLARGSRIRQILGPKLLVFFAVHVFHEADMILLSVQEADATWLPRWKKRVKAFLGRWLTRSDRYTDGWRVHTVTDRETDSQLDTKLRVWWDRWGLTAVECDLFAFDQAREIPAASAEKEATK